MNITIVTATVRLEGLKKAIKSIDNQTYRRWQHIIINDNNSDIRERLDDLCHDNRRHWIDIGVKTHYYGGFARNLGAMIAFSYFKDKDRSYDNEWVCFLDDDNLWYPNHLETLIKGHEEKPEATLIGVDTEVRGYKNSGYRILKCQIASQNCDLGSFIYKKKLFEKYQYFRPRIERKISYDWELIEIMAKGEGVDKVHIVHKPTFIFYSKKR